MRPPPTTAAMVTGDFAPALPLSLSQFSEPQGLLNNRERLDGIRIIDTMITRFFKTSYHGADLVKSFSPFRSGLFSSGVGVRVPIQLRTRKHTADPACSTTQR